MEMLGLALRQNNKIQGVTLGESKIKIKPHQYADDDLWTVCPATAQNLNQILVELDEFKKYSGLKINPEQFYVSVLIGNPKLNFTP